MGPVWMLILWRPRSIPLVVTRPFNWFLLLVVWVYYSGWLVHGFQEFNFLLVIPLRYDHAKPAATCSTLFQLAAAKSCVSQVWERRCPKTLWCHLIQFRILFFFGVRPQLFFGELNQNLEDNICGFQFSCLDRPSLLRHGNRRLRCAGPLPLAKRRPTRRRGDAASHWYGSGCEGRTGRSSTALWHATHHLPWCDFKRMLWQGILFSNFWYGGMELPLDKWCTREWPCGPLSFLFIFLKFITSNTWALSAWGIPDSSLCLQVSNYRIVYLPADFSPRISRDKIHVYTCLPQQ